MSEIDPREQISTYLDGQLQGEELAAFESALGSDAELAAEVDGLRTLVADLGALPPVEAPPGFAEGVLSRVADIPIPGTQAMGEDVGVVTESGAAADIPRLALSVIAGPDGLPGLLRALAQSLWLKVPAGVAAAALLALGFSHLIRPDVAGPPSAELAALAESPMEERLDGVVELDGEISGAFPETAPLEEAELSEPEPDPLMQRPESRVRSGSSVPSTPEKSPRPARSKRKKKPESAVGKDGVYEAAWESEDGVVLAEEAPSPSGSEFEEDKEEELDLASADAAERRRSVLGTPADITMAGEPLEDHLEPEADDELVQAPSAPLEIDEQEILMGAARRGGGGGATGRGSARRSEAPMAAAPADEASASSNVETMTLERKRTSSPKAGGPSSGNRLKVGSRARANRLVQDLQRLPNYDVQVTRHSGYFVLEVAYPRSEGGSALMSKLRKAGTLEIKKSAVLRAEQEILRFNVVW